MMYAVIRWRHKHVFEPAKLTHMLRMHPELVDQVQGAHCHHHLGGHTDEKQGRVKNPPKKKTRARLTQSRRQVVILALMVNHVRGPKKLHFMSRSMRAVVAKVIEHKGK